MAKNDGGVNFIRHLLSISEKFIDDHRLGPLHISLYYALFHSWNLSKFRNPISVSRDELMRASKIGSANTYTKCLKELDAWEYLKYYPSHNPHKGSQVYLYNFNKTTDKSTDRTIEKGTAKTTVKAVIPSINRINNTNNLNIVNTHEHTSGKINTKSSSVDNGKSNGKKEKLRQKKKSGTPTLQILQKHFANKNWPKLEAEKFFNYYQSNGWLVGGKTPMKNWKAATGNWMINAEKFTNGKSKTTAGKLHATTAKNYSEPL